MPRFDEEGLWLERVNKNLLPLLAKFGIKRQGAFGLSNIILPIVNVETLEEVLEQAQLLATVQGNLAAVGDELLLTVPAGETWKLEHTSFRTAAASVVRADILMLRIGGANYGLTPGVAYTNAPTALQYGDSFAFPHPLFLAEGDSVVVRRQTGASTATLTNFALWYRVA